MGHAKQAVSHRRIGDCGSMRNLRPRPEAFLYEPIGRLAPPQCDLTRERTIAAAPSMHAIRTPNTM
jgi:hypothetical protein